MPQQQQFKVKAYGTVTPPPVEETDADEAEAEGDKGSK